jgi:hypothetical protein
MERQNVRTVQKTPGRGNHRKTQSAYSTSAVQPLLALQRSIGNQAAQRLINSPYIQTKLQISTPGDPYEQEADRVADTVMRMAEPKPATKEDEKPLPAKSLATGISRLAQRAPEQPLEEEKEKVAAKLLAQRAPVAVREDDDEKKVATKLETSPTPQEEEKEKSVQAKGGQTPASGATATVSANIDALNSGGSPLPNTTRAFFEPRFGADFSGVRVHTDSRTAETAKSINARAFTVGPNIGFATGQYAPDSQHGRHVLAHELTHVVQQGAVSSERQVQRTPEKTQAFPLGGSGSLIQRAGPEAFKKTLPPSEAAIPGNKIAFVREEGLNLRAAPDQHSASVNKLKFGQRVYLVEDSNPQPGWLKIAVLGQTGYAFAPRVYLPPENLIQKDPALRLIKVRPGLSFWTLVKEVYDIEGNESTKDQNMNHFINAIRAFNKDEAFNVKTDMLDDIGNFFLSGRDAKNVYLKANYDLWIPSFGVASKMDVGSGTVRGELTRFVKKIQQKIDDFKNACSMSVAYMPAAIAKRAGEVGMGLLTGLLEFAKDAVKILAISTAVGALIGALFGGVGAIPGAEIGFEIGLLILEVYGLAMLIEAVLGIAVDLVVQLGRFISVVWDANGDKKQLDLAARTLADAIGILVSAILIAVAAYLLKKGGEALGKTKFAQTVGETRLAQWLKERQQFKTTLGEEKTSKRIKMKPDVKPSAPKGWKGTMSEFGEKIGWPAQGKTKIPAEKVDLRALREASVTQEWASEQAAIYREVARMNPKNPTATLRADWLEKIANRLGGTK